MGLRTLLFTGLFGTACVAGLMSPIWSILGYVGHYLVGPERQWWHAPLRDFGIRYSFVLAIITAVSIGIRWDAIRSKIRGVVLCRHEKLLLLFAAIVWVSTLIGSETVGRYTRSDIDHPSVKFTKIVIFLLMMTHVVSDWKNLQRLIWALILGAMILGMQAYELPQSAFRSGRLETVGGADFAQANYFGGFMASILFIIGVQFLQSDWKGKIVCFLAGGFTANAIVLTRSRGATVGLLTGATFAIFCAPKRYRMKLAVGVVAAGIGFMYLTDERFVERFLTVFAAEDERDSSAESRIELTRAGIQMWQDHPLGVGAGNFYQYIGHYIPAWAGKDAHNAYIRCLTELGIQGIIVFVLTIFSAWQVLREVNRLADSLPPPEQFRVRLTAYGMGCTIASAVTCCSTASLLYIEYLWWFLLLPVCLLRATDELVASHTVCVQDAEGVEVESPQCAKLNT